MSADLRGAGGLPQDPGPDPPLLLGPGALWLLLGPDWHVAGPRQLVAGEAGEAGALVATEGRVALGWGAMAGSMPSGWP